MKFLSKKQVRELDNKIECLEKHVNLLEDKLSDKYFEITNISNELQSKKKYAEDYVKLYREAKLKNDYLEKKIEEYISKCETLEVVIDKIQGDLCESKTENRNMLNELKKYDDVCKKAFNNLAHKAKTKRLKKKREKELYYTILDIQKK